MTDDKILTKAIQVALLNGWTDYFEWRDPVANDGTEHYSYIFQHSFAKAFWGDKLITVERIYGTRNETSLVKENRDRVRLDGFKAYYCQADGHHAYLWQYHLMQMVLEEEPLKYLERFLQ